MQADLDDALWWLNVILKSRQHGVTTYFCIRWLDTCLFAPGTKCGIIAHTAKDAAKFFRGKILFAYERLPQYLREACPIKKIDQTGYVEFANGSSIEVGVSLRGGTVQRLHISEYGPMCAMYPQRAEEVRTGALNTVHEGGIVAIESTAYGARGDFHDRAKIAQALDARVKAGTAELTRMDYQFHFFAWWQDAKNCLSDEDAARVEIGADLKKYFDKLETEIRHQLSPGQRAWYVKKALEQGDLMKREHPSTPAEAFETSIRGAYYELEMLKARKEGRIGAVPFFPGVPVNTFWDIGRNDSTAIWFHQRVGLQNRFIHFYQNNGRNAAHYASVLHKLAAENDYVYGGHYLPHDVAVTEWTQSENLTRKQVLERLRVKPVIAVKRIADLNTGIEMMRQAFPSCYFDAVNCKDGIDALDHYAKKWDDDAQDYLDQPQKSWANHAADAIRQFAQGYTSEDADFNIPDEHIPVLDSVTGF